MIIGQHPPYCHLPKSPSETGERGFSPPPKCPRPPPDRTQTGQDRPQTVQDHPQKVKDRETAREAGRHDAGRCDAERRDAAYNNSRMDLYDQNFQKNTSSNMFDLSFSIFCYFRCSRCSMIALLRYHTGMRAKLPTPGSASHPKGGVRWKRCPAHPLEGAWYNPREIFTT